MTPEEMRTNVLAAKKALGARRKAIKKANLKDAREHFPLKAKRGDTLTKIEVKQWFIKNRYRSWKQKGIEGDYFTRDHDTIWFREEEKRTLFILSCK